MGTMLVPDSRVAADVSSELHKLFRIDAVPALPLNIGGDLQLSHDGLCLVGADRLSAVQAPHDRLQCPSRGSVHDSALPRNQPNQPYEGGRGCGTPRLRERTPPRPTNFTFGKIFGIETMGTRGRKSLAELATSPVLIETKRPAPPPELNATEAAIWRAAVGTMPFGWIGPAQFPILAAYCRHTHRANDLAKLIEAFEFEWLSEDGGLERFNKLLAMAERETRALTACARSMRITHQSQILPRGAGRRMAGSRGPMPWEDHASLGNDPMFDDYEGGSEAAGA